LSGDPKLKPDSIVIALNKDREIELIVKGRKSGKNLPRPVWFVLKGKELLLLPVTGTDSQWYKNILRDPQVKISSNRQSFSGKLRAITEKGQVEEVIKLFRGKYGASDVKRYYPKPNVAASLLLD
jgi:hypothetical protein